MDFWSIRAARCPDRFAGFSLDGSRSSEIATQTGAPQDGRTGGRCEEHKGQLEILKISQRGGILPLSARIHYNMQIIELLDKGKLTSQTLRKLTQQCRDLEKVIEEFSPPPPR